MESCGKKRSKQSDPDRKRLILVGNPNVGKSVIFNYLTGKYTTVSNYPGTTVEVAAGTMTISGKKFLVVDTPGVNSLIPLSEDEKVTRDILLREPNHHLVQVIDAKNLRRGLLISLQLLEMGLPFIIVLNMWDEAKNRGIEINLPALSDHLNIPILKTVATRKKGLDKIKGNFDLDLPKSPPLTYPEPLERGISRIIPLLPKTFISERSLALMLLAGDESLTGWLHEHLSDKDILQIETIRQETQARFNNPIGYLINQVRLRKADEMLSRVMVSQKETPKTFLTFLGNLSIHPFWGILVLLAVLWITYQFVGVFGAQTGVEFLEETVFEEWLLPPLARLVERFIPFPIVREFLIGPYGVVSMALTYAIAIILPIVGCFFIMFGLMEDSGYLPRLAIITNRIFKKMGLNGKAVLPMVLGLGCDTMATMTTRILDTEKDRTVVTLLLALGVPCSAQLGVILGMFAGLPVLYLLIWVFLIGAILVAVGYLAARIIPGESSDFILEIPPMRIPQLANVLAKTLARIEWYLKEAVPLFILGTLILFFLHKTGILIFLEQVTTPLFVHFLGLPAKVTESFIIGFLRRDYGAAGLFILAKEGVMNPQQTLVGLVTITLFIPCIAQFFMMIKERGIKKTLWISAIIFPIAFGIGGMLNFLLRWIGI